MWWSVLVLLAAMLIVGVASMLHTTRTARESEQRWCALLTTMDTAYREQPPTTPTGRRLATDVAELRAQFGCR